MAQLSAIELVESWDIRREERDVFLVKESIKSGDRNAEALSMK